MLAIALLCASLTLYAQKKSITDTTVVLNPVEINTNRLDDFGTGNRTVKIDSLSMKSFSATTLSDLLSKQGLLFVKSYGSGGIGTASMRGTSAAHTAVQWNGFSLQSPMNGSLDLSLIPAGFVDDISIRYGGSGALSGSGAMGGTISLNNTPLFGSGIKARVGAYAGSFMNLGSQALFEAGTHTNFISLKGFYQSGKNDFPFYNTALAGAPKEKQSHAGVELYGITLAENLLVGKNQKLSVNLWHTSAHREIPALMITNDSLAVLEDVAYRGSAEWQYSAKRTSWFIRTAVLSEKEHYTDPIFSTDSHNDFLNSITEFESRIILGKNHLLNIGLNNSFEQANTTNYTDIVSRERLAVLVNYRFRNLNEQVTASVSVREEYSGNEFLLPVPSAGLDLKIWKGGIMKTAVSRVYRLPSLNDLYWNPGGNIKLKPESGWSGELGLTQKIKSKKFCLSIGATGYYSNISNWIIWLPSDSMVNIWSPKNVMEVAGSGIELDFNADYSIKRFLFRLMAHYNYSRSVNRKAKLAGDASLNKQLIYVPQHAAAGDFAIIYRGFVLTYAQMFTGKRYTTSDNTDFLPAFTTGDVRLSKKINLKSFAIDVAFSVENVWNTTYQAIAWMPMPGRAFRGSLSFEFIHPIKNKIK